MNIKKSIDELCSRARKSRLDVGDYDIRQKNAMLNNLCRLIKQNENAQSAILKACTIQFANDDVAALRHHNTKVKNKRRCGKKKKEARKTFAVWIVIMLQT